MSPVLTNIMAHGADSPVQKLDAGARIEGLPAEDDRHMLHLAEMLPKGLATLCECNAEATSETGH